jgi:hypothetical protein
MTEMTDTQKSVYELVKEQFGKMKMSKKYSNQARLCNRCQEIIYNEWGMGTQGLWDLVDKYVKEFIPDHMD